MYVLHGSIITINKILHMGALINHYIGILNLSFLLLQ